MDIQKFHRTIPLLPHHKPFLVFQDPIGNFFIDHVFCFGASPASSNSGMVSAALRDIWSAKGIAPVAKVEDDLAVFRTPSGNGSYHYDRESALDMVHPLGFPWHSPDKKGDPFFIPVFTFIGLLWDIPRKQVSLPDEKRKKYIFRIQSFIDLHTSSSRRSIPPSGVLPAVSKAPLNKVESIHGTVCYLIFILREGSSHLPVISNFMASYKGREVDIGKFTTTIVIRELEWWLDQLQNASFIRQLRARGPITNLNIFADASTDWGIGIWIKGHWAAFRLKPGWKVEGRDICWLETLAIELIAYFLEAMDITGLSVIIRSDNQGTIGAMAKARSPNRWINLSVRRTFATLTSLDIDPVLHYIESSKNPADALSRGILGYFSDRLTPSITLPLELDEVMYRV